MQSVFISLVLLEVLMHELDFREGKLHGASSGMKMGGQKLFYWECCWNTVLWIPLLPKPVCICDHIIFSTRLRGLPVCSDVIFEENAGIHVEIEAWSTKTAVNESHHWWLASLQCPVAEQGRGISQLQQGSSDRQRHLNEIVEWRNNTLSCQWCLMPNWRGRLLSRKKL